MRFEASESFARALDAEDPLRGLRKEFLLPKSESGKPCVYLAGHSLGLQPRRAKAFIERELDAWARLGVEGHFRAKDPWVSYHELVTKPLARLAGAKAVEVVAMNALSVNLHLMMTSFYRPTARRHKILMETDAFPSDRYAAASQARLHSFDPVEAVAQARPEEILSRIEEDGSSIALVLLGNVNYLTGEALDAAAIVEAARGKGCIVGFDLAHGAGNLELKLHDWGADFAVWCCYKYLNAGPGSLGACFVHERHAKDNALPRLAGWWGHDKKTRFLMTKPFAPIPGAEGWQLSNPPIFQLAALRASLELFDAAGMARLRRKSELLTGYLEFLLGRLPRGYCAILTPKDPALRGCQLSLRVREKKDRLLKRLGARGVVVDFREPDVVRAAPVPLYNRFLDVHRFVQALNGDKA